MEWEKKILNEWNEINILLIVLNSLFSRNNLPPFKLVQITKFDISTKYTNNHQVCRLLNDWGILKCTKWSDLIVILLQMPVHLLYMLISSVIIMIFQHLLANLERFICLRMDTFCYLFSSMNFGYNLLLTVYLSFFGVVHFFGNCSQNLGQNVPNYRLIWKDNVDIFIDSTQ